MAFWSPGRANSGYNYCRAAARGCMPPPGTNTIWHRVATGSFGPIRLSIECTRWCWRIFASGHSRASAKAAFTSNLQRDLENPAEGVKRLFGELVGIQV